MIKWVERMLIMNPVTKFSIPKGALELSMMQFPVDTMDKRCMLFLMIIPMAYLKQKNYAKLLMGLLFHTVRKNDNRNSIVTSMSQKMEILEVVSYVRMGTTQYSNFK